MCFVGCNERINISMLAAKPPRTLSRPKAVVMGKSWGARMAAEAMMEGSLVTVICYMIYGLPIGIHMILSTLIYLMLLSTLIHLMSYDMAPKKNLDGKTHW
jgi:hypothetical protein